MSGGGGGKYPRRQMTGWGGGKCPRGKCPGGGQMSAIRLYRLFYH